MSVKPYKGPFSSFLLESSPAWIFIVGIVCVVLTPLSIWLRMLLLDAGPVDLFELQSGQFSDSSLVYSPYDTPGSSSNQTIKKALAFGFGVSGVITGVLAAVLPIWAAARLIADAVREQRTA